MFSIPTKLQIDYYLSWYKEHSHLQTSLSIRRTLPLMPHLGGLKVDKGDLFLVADTPLAHERPAAGY